MILHLDFQCKNGEEVYYSRENLEWNNGLWDLFWHIFLLWSDLTLLLENGTLYELFYDLSILKSY